MGLYRCMASLRTGQNQELEEHEMRVSNKRKEIKVCLGKIIRKDQRGEMVTFLSLFGGHYPALGTHACTLTFISE